MATLMITDAALILKAPFQCNLAKPLQIAFSCSYSKAEMLVSMPGTQGDSFKEELFQTLAHQFQQVREDLWICAMNPRRYHKETPMLHEGQTLLVRPLVLESRQRAAAQLLVNVVVLLRVPSWWVALTLVSTAIPFAFFVHSCLNSYSCFKADDAGVSSTLSSAFIPMPA